MMGFGAAEMTMHLHAVAWSCPGQGFGLLDQFSANAHSIVIISL